jgi:hypothetical protein
MEYEVDSREYVLRPEQALGYVIHEYKEKKQHHVRNISQAVGHHLLISEARVHFHVSSC